MQRLNVTRFIGSPENSFTAFILGHLLSIVEIGLSDGDECVFSGRHVPLPDLVLTTNISGIDSRVVGRLYPAWPPGAALQQAVAIGSRVQFSSVGFESGVSVSNSGVA